MLDTLCAQAKAGAIQVLGTWPEYKPRRHRYDGGTTCIAIAIYDYENMFIVIY